MWRASCSRSQLLFLNIYCLLFEFCVFDLCVCVERMTRKYVLLNAFRFDIPPSRRISFCRKWELTVRHAPLVSSHATESRWIIFMIAIMNWVSLWLLSVCVSIVNCISFALTHIARTHSPCSIYAVQFASFFSCLFECNALIYCGTFCWQFQLFSFNSCVRVINIHIECVCVTETVAYFLICRYLWG